MKNIITFIFIIVQTLSLFASEESPQIAYNILNDYITKKESGASDKTGAIITMSVGGVLLGGSIGMWFFGDDIIRSFSENDETWDPVTKNIVCGSIAGGGLLTFGIGLAIFIAPPKDYRSQYAFVFNEEDYIVKEALAEGVLYDLAQEGKNKRLTQGFSNLALPLVTIIIQVVANLATERTWYKDIHYSTYSTSWNLITGISQIFFEKSEEERLYSKYIHIKQSYLVAGANN